jgi:uncharacterized protein (DUF2336 family)
MSSPRFALLKELSNQGSSEERRALLRLVTETLDQPARLASETDMAALDQLLSTVAQEYSLEVRTEFARLVAASVNRFCDSAAHFAMDDIEVAAPVLRHSQTLSEETLLKVVAQKSQQHMLAVTKRASISPTISHALVERGDDDVVRSLLDNRQAQIADATFDVVAQRAGNSSQLQAPLVRRTDVPMDLLHGLYQNVETELRREIMEKFKTVSPEELEKAFQRSRSRVTGQYHQPPEDMPAARKRLAALEKAGLVQPPVLVSLMREGPGARTLFKLVCSRLVDVDFDVVDRAIESCDLDTFALLCRGARFDKGLFVTMAVGLDQSARGLANAEQFGALYDSVPIEAAQRALRFWKVRAA